MTGAGRAAPEVVLALDIGTSGARAFAYDRAYTIRASASRLVRTRTAPDGASWQDWAELASSALDCVRQVTGDGGVEVAALVLSGTASCLVASWRQDDELRAGEVVLWSDRRAVLEQRELADLSQAGYPRTLCPSHVSYWPAKLRWLERHEPHPALGT